MRWVDFLSFASGQVEDFSVLTITDSSTGVMESSNGEVFRKQRTVTVFASAEAKTLSGCVHGQWIVTTGVVLT